MSNFKKFLEIQKINRQIRSLERDMYNNLPENNMWSPALGFGVYHQPSAIRRPSEKEVLYRRSINKLVEEKKALRTN
ncbi:MAG: hypothetical protein H9W81_08415 [Enterococcus sp.]|nr:hypothetical protein [Enterococcus sp.]